MALIKLIKVIIGPYKSIQQAQTVDIDPRITTIVGMNESGKTSFLTAIAKTNYFTNDPDFVFDMIQDYPRKDLIDFQSSEEDCDIITCYYEISKELRTLIDNEFGKNVFTSNSFSFTYHYKSKATINGLLIDSKIYLEHKVAQYNLSDSTKSLIIKSETFKEIEKIIPVEGDLDLPTLKLEINKIITGGYENWPNSLDSFIVKNWIKTKMPKFWYFDDYYPLGGKININKLINQPPTKDKEKTSKALFELAKIKPEDILNSTENDYEKYIALLEASSNKITNEIFKYWSANSNLDIEFKIQKYNKLARSA